MTNRQTFILASSILAASLLIAVLPQVFGKQGSGDPFSMECRLYAARLSSAELGYEIYGIVGQSVQKSLDDAKEARIKGNCARIPSILPQ